MGSRRPVRPLVVVFVALAALLVGAGFAGAGESTPTASTSAPRVLKLSGRVDFISIVNQYGCFLTAGISYVGRSDALSYTIRYTDDGRPMEKTQPPFETETEATYPWGWHFVGLAGFNSSDVRGCPNAEEGYRNRFKLTEVTAVIDRRDASISGRVTADGKPLRGVPVSATKLLDNVNYPAYGRGVILGTRTDATGFYRIPVAKQRLGLYDVAADLSRTPFGDKDRYTDRTARVEVMSGQDLTADFTVKRWAPNADPGAVASVTEIRAMDRSKPAKAEFLRDGNWFTVSTATQLRPGERVRTDGNTAVAVELDLGGRVAIKPGSEVEVTGERSATEIDPKRGVKLTKGGVWAKCGQMKESLEIQVTGGVMGIKG